MKKKIQVTVLVVALLFTVWQAYASKSMPSTYVSISVPNNFKFGQSFPIYAEGHIGCSAEASMDITLPDGIRLLKGNLHSHANFGSKYVLLNEELTAQVEKPGTYVLTNVLSVSKSADSIETQHFPRHYIIYLYASKDTVLAFAKRSDMEKAIRDSLVFPGVATRRLEEESYKRMRAFRVKTNARPFTYMFDLAYIANNACVTFSGNFDAGFLSDTIKTFKLAENYSSDQVRLIHQHQLLYAPPKLNLVEKFLDYDFHGTITDEKMSAMAVVLKRQLTELYELDQQILRTDQIELRDSLLTNRATLLRSQTEERKSVVK